MSMTDRAIGRRILDRVGALGPETTCCPSDIARELGGKEWRDIMPCVRGGPFNSPVRS